ncbi:MAG: aldo/keto reductase, partial [Ilumatobacteraceae bacterium]
MLPSAPFGNTGHQSTRLIFGAAALGGMSQTRADATLAAVAGWGINHIDTAAAYGASEDRLKPWLAEHRGDVFLATKTGERDGAAARAELERSLQRMDVDHVDLIQLHNLVEPDEWEIAHGPGGAVEALAQARDEGLVGHIGVTGHGLRIAEMHLRSLERFPFDAVLFPYNHSLLAEPAYRADVEALVEKCAADGVALQTI